MPLAIRIILLLAFLALPGLATMPLFRKGLKRLDGLERAFTAVVLGAGAVAVVALILAAAGVYSLGALLGVVLGLSALLLLLRRPSKADLASSHIKDLVLALLAVVLAVVLFSPPSHFAFGGFDVGTYANIAAHIEREGQINETDEVVTLVAPERRDMLYLENRNQNLPYEAREFQGFYITDYEKGTVVPQFFHLWPSFMAVFASFLGVAGMFWAVTFMAVLAVLGLFLLVRRYLGSAAGAVAVLLAVTFMPMVYFSKYTTSEICNLAFFLAGMLALSAYLEPGEIGESEEAAGLEQPDEKGDALLAVFAGLFFVLGMLTRIDFLFVAIPLVALFLYRIIMKTARLGDYLFLGMVGLGIAAGLAEGFVLSAPYTATLLSALRNGRLSNWLPGIILAVALITLALVFRGRLRATIKALGRKRGILAFIGAAALIAAALYLYFLRPRGVDTIVPYVEELDVWGPSFIKDIFVRWGWYFSWFGLALGTLGYAYWLIREKRFKAALPWVVGMFFTAYYVMNMHSSPLHIIVMRRIMPVIFPVAVLMICYALFTLREYGNRLLKKRFGPLGLGEAVLAVLLVPLIVFLIFSSRPVYGLNEGEGELAFTRQIASGVDEDGIVLISPWLGNLAGPALRYFEGVETARLTSYDLVSSDDLVFLLEDLGTSGSPVYLLWDNTQALNLSGRFTITDSVDLPFGEELLETSFDHRPDKLMNPAWNFTLMKLTAN